MYSVLWVINTQGSVPQQTVKLVGSTFLVRALQFMLFTLGFKVTLHHQSFPFSAQERCHFIPITHWARAALSSASTLLRDDCLIWQSFNAALIASSANIEQCNLTGGRDSSFTISVFYFYLKKQIKFSLLYSCEDK